MPMKHHAIAVPESQRIMMIPTKTLCGKSTGHELDGERVIDLGRFDPDRSDACGACSASAVHWASPPEAPDRLILRAFD